MSLLKAPLAALYDLNFYRRAAAEKVSKGFLYLVYMSVLAAVLAVMAYNIRIAPETQRFVEWFKADMPASLVWTPEGLQMPLQVPYAMIHEKYGPVILFDLQAGEITSAEMKDYLILVTAQKIYFRPAGGVGDIRSYDITQLNIDSGSGQPEPVQITPVLVQKTYDAMRPWILFVVFAAVLVVFFIWKVMAALFYSWFGLLINMGRHDKLDYPQILNISVFALTPVIIINFLKLFIPPLEYIPFGLIGSFTLTMIYLFWILKKTDTKPVE